MKIDTIRKTKIYQEMELENARDLFEYTRSKYISHIDTFYYSVKTLGQWNENPGARNLVADLQRIKEVADREKTEQPIMPDDKELSNLIMRPSFGFRMYRYGITKTDCFDIFVADNVPNADTSTIVVQLRSQFIWLRGVRGAFRESLDCLIAILEKHQILIADITENRIDFAYHTNYIQNMTNFFKDEHIGKMQVSNFARGGKEWAFGRDDIDTDYLSIGRRTSNNAFVRIYNKSKEVINGGYKQFFVPIWHEQGMISKFDRYIFDAIFDAGKTSWNYKDVCRCQFYVEHGSDQSMLDAIRELMGNPNASAEDYKRLADMCVPDLTTVANIEIQTKRKFYTGFKVPKEIVYPETLPLHETRIHAIFEMLHSIRKFITHDTIRFVNFKGEYANMRPERRPTANWWLRLASCGELDGVDYDLCKEYQRKYDVQRSKNRSMSSIAMLASLLDGVIEKYHLGEGLHEDVADLLCCFNDNDLQRYDKMRTKKRREVQSRFT